MFSLVIFVKMQSNGNIINTKELINRGKNKTCQGIVV